MTHAFVCDAVRTPFGRYGGALAEVRADDLAAWPVRALLERRPDVDWAAVDEVVLGCANQAGEDNRNLARMAALLAGLPETVPGVTVNRLCGSGLEAVVQAARAVRCGEAGLVLAGGAESMTRAPFVMAKAETAFARTAEVFDTTIGWRFVNPAMAAAYGTHSMPETAENLAELYGISREAQDAFALRSQRRAARAAAAGVFAEEIVPVRVPGRKGEKTVAVDEHPRPDVDLAQLAALPAPFRAGGTVTAGNASGVNDGAAVLVVASEAEAARRGLVPRARVVAAASAGVAPRIMGIGPVPAARRALSLAGLTLSDIDVVEINEAFAVQVLACARDLDLDPEDERLNPNGGAIALGHPLGASGARLVQTAAAELVRRNGRHALVALCVGVGQGIALVLERV